MSATPKEFEQFLSERFGLDTEQQIWSSEWSGTGNTIGALALRLGILDLDQIDQILDLQQEDKRLFGELAIYLEFMTEQQVERLIGLQRYHQLLEIGESLVVNGSIGLTELQRALADFYEKHVGTLVAGVQAAENSMR